MFTVPIVLILAYFIIPLWFIAGISDWICHRITRIEETSGTKESSFHMLMFFESGLILFPILFLQINAAVILLISLVFIIHEVTAFLDVTCATKTRFVSPAEQFIHSFLEIIPLMVVTSMASTQWQQFLSIFGYWGNPSWGFSLKFDLLPNLYLEVIMVVTVVFGFFPYAEELVRCIRSKGLKRQQKPMVANGRAQGFL
jgi:hypothetical protein